MTPGCVFYFLDIGLACLHKCLLTLQAARIEWPDELRIQSFCSLINAKEPSFPNVFGLVDGLTLPLQNTRILILKMLTTMDGKASTLQAKFVFNDLMIVSSMPMSMPLVAG